MSNEVLSLTKSDFDAEAFIPSTYNATYYGEVMEDEARLIEWQAGELHDTVVEHLQSRGLDKFSHQWEAGSGPSVHHLFALEKYSDRIDLSDFLPENLEEIRKWVRGEASAHDWQPFVEQILAAEGQDPTPAAVAEREALVRSKIASYQLLDLKNPTAEMLAYKAPFVTSYFVADSATGDTDTFIEMTKNAFNIVESGGLFAGTYLGGCTHYKVGDQWVVSADVQQSDIEKAFELCGAKDVVIRRIETPSLAEEGFDHIFTVTAKAA